MNVTIFGVEYPLATTLRVAYKVQGQHNHKPYSQVFSEIGNMTLEDQISILFAAFKVANPENQLTSQQFLDYYLDHFNLKVVMDQVKEVIEGIMGAEKGWICGCGNHVTTKFCSECGAKNPEFIEHSEEGAQGN